MKQLAFIGLAIPALALGQATTGRSSVEIDPSDLPLPAKERVAPDHESWWQNAVFYEVFVRSFADSTRGPLAGDGVGDLRGLIERLDYLNDGDPTTDDDLGVTALWLMPICESPSYHGYDTDDYYSVDQEYGTNDEFKLLVSEAEKRGIRIIVDLVLNHISRDHPWFTKAKAGEAPYEDLFIFADEFPGYRGPWGQQVWHPVPDQPGRFYYGVFSSHMPDLDYRNEQVTERMFDAVRFWLEDMGAAGFRLDAIRHLIERGSQQDNTPETHRWLERFHEFYKSIDPEALTVGEVWADTEVVSRFTGGQMDLAFEFDTGYAITETINSGHKSALTRQLALVDEQFPLGMYATFLRNHDQPRTRNELGGDLRKAKLAAAIQFALPGVPFIYYGEEIGMLGTKPDELIRTPMQWEDSPKLGFTTGEPWAEPNGGVASSNVADQTRDRASLLSTYRRLIRARADHEVLRSGELRIIETPSPDVLAFERRLDDKVAIAVFNLSDRVGPTRMIWRGEPPLAPGSTAVLDLVSDEMLRIDTRPVPSTPPGSVAALSVPLAPYQARVLVTDLRAASPGAEGPQPRSR
ncbi:MAG: alpha-amylase family glycosyl hydrolase [Planctomycetota bacterium]